ncbi:DegT/DnrJ/EryC1/StrS family aminotransferase [Streptomyces coacervatus]|uniref:DegT/DnrJ/EryC1/StrS aminotransferase family protein n=1 Tax=Streptomyces coacervatus TaxID=647381 RepID=UPI0023DABEB4|nr:DegT/DnrJ/EryC1/StrS family aminotransferase [Streptomyces coacervatus]MDF2272049.1 DegT/DnrJ/EryC1/StrS family aminotransferase [Streptomyces coacervatus]
MSATPSEIITGDSTSLAQLVIDVQQRRTSQRRCAPSLANRALEAVLAEDAGRLDPAHPDSIFTLEPRLAAGEGVPFLPRERLLTPAEQRTVIERFARAVATGQLTSGPAVARFEAALADFLGLPHAVATGSGTDALITALRAVGVSQGDEVIVPANSFAATENAVWACGATPVLADVDPVRHTLDPAQTQAVITSRTRAILPVHLYGRFADIPALVGLARRHGLSVVEDACQAIGVTGVGVHSDAAALSFNPYKNFGLTGKAGAVVTRDTELAARVRKLAYHGFDPEQKNVKDETFGLNTRIDNATAEVALGLMPRLTLNSYRRTFLAKRYLDCLGDLEPHGAAVLPAFVQDHSWHLFGLQVAAGREVRDAVRAHMRSLSRVETDIYYPVLTHHQQTPLHRKLFAHVSLPSTERLHSTVVHLPLHNNLSLAEQDRVIEALHAAFRATH